MKPARLYANALRRFNRSRGFGIHSPFAYSFVRDTLCCRHLHYYAYEQLAWLRQVALDMARGRARHPRVMSVKTARMLHRVAVRSGARDFLQIGSHFGLSTAALLMADSRACLTLYNPSNDHDDIYAEVTREFEGRISRSMSADAGSCIADYVAHADGRPFILVNDITGDDDVSSAAGALGQLAAAGECVIIFRNLTRSRSHTSEVWQRVVSGLVHGMSFTNGTIGFVVVLKHLPVQHFTLWF